MKTERYLIEIEMPDGDNIGTGWLKDDLQSLCDSGEDAGRCKVVACTKLSLPSVLDEAAKEYSLPFRGGRDIWMSDITDAFKAGAEWMARQGETIEGEVVKDINNNLAITAKGFSDKEAVFGDKVIVQIRKK